VSLDSKMDFTGLALSSPFLTTHRVPDMVQALATLSSSWSSSAYDEMQASGLRPGSSSWRPPGGRGVVSFVLENSEPDGRGGEPDDDRRRRFVRAGGKSASAEDLLDGVGELGEGGDVPLGLGGCKDGLEQLFVDSGSKVGL